MTKKAPAAGQTAMWQPKLFGGILILFACMAVLLVYQVKNGYSDSMQRGERQTQDYAKILTLHLDDVLRGAEANLRRIAQLLPADAYKKRSVQKFERDVNSQFDKILVNFPEINGFRVFDASGDLLYSNDASRVNRANIFDRTHFTATSEAPLGVLTFSDVLVSRVSNDRIVVISLPVRDKAGIFLGIVTTSIDINYFARLFSTFAIGRDGLLAIVRSDSFKQVLRWPEVGDRLNVALAAESPARRLMSGGIKQATQVAPSAVDGITRIYSYSRIENFPFFVVVAVSKQEILAEWRSRMILSGIFMLVLISALAVFLIAYRRLSGAHDVAVAELAVHDKHLAQSEERLRLSMSAGAIGIWEFDLHSRETWCSPQHAKIFGVREDWRWGFDEWLLHVVVEDRQRVQESIERAPLLGYLRWEARILRADNQMRWVFAEGIVKRDESGEPRTINGTIVDITDQKKAEQEQRLTGQILMNMEEGVCMVRADEGTIVYANHKFERMFGYEIGELEGRSVSILNADARSTAAEIAREIMEVLGREGRWQGEIENIKKDGTRMWCHASVSGMDHLRFGRVWVSVQLDISARKLAEQKLIGINESLEARVAERTGALRIAKEAAEAASRAKTVFLANMSHELRTPMNAIMGMTDLALRVATDAKQADWLKKSSAASRHLLEIIDDVLDISRIEADKLELECRQFELSRVFGSVSMLLSEKAVAKGLQFFCELPADLRGLTVLGDQMRLEQVLINLVSNAIKFTKEGSITVGAKVESNDGSSVVLRFEVADTGIGISGKNLSRIFNPFEQADGSISREYGGTGLGLAICKRLVTAMGGQIEAQSGEGKGSVFSFTTRLAKARAIDAVDIERMSLAEMEARLRKHYRGARILAVEDDPLNQELLVEQLSEVGLSVEIACDGADAIEMMKRIPYDFVFMDMRMPKVDGITATREIRKSPERLNMPIIGFTANVLEEDRKKCIESGMNDFLTKPCQAIQLYAMLLKWLEGRHLATQGASRSNVLNFRV